MKNKLNCFVAKKCCFAVGGKENEQFFLILLDILEILQILLKFKLIGNSFAIQKI